MQTVNTVENLQFDEVNLVIGTIAKTIYGDGIPSRAGNAALLTLQEDEKKIKPKQIILPNDGLREKMLPSLKAMGIHPKYVTLADSEIIQEAAVKRQHNDNIFGGDNTAFAINPSENPQEFIRALADNVRTNLQGIPYVSEELYENGALRQFRSTMTKFPKHSDTTWGYPNI